MGGNRSEFAGACGRRRLPVGNRAGGTEELPRGTHRDAGGALAVQVRVAASGLRAAAASVLLAEAAFFGKRIVSESARQVATLSDAAACRPLPDDEALTDGGSASCRGAAEH